MNKTLEQYGLTCPINNHTKKAKDFQSRAVSVCLLLPRVQQ